MSEEVLNAEEQKRRDIEYHKSAAAKYDADVTSYFDFYHIYSLHPWVQRLLQKYPQASAVDLGTGTGVVACTLAKFGCRVRAIDHSPEMLAIAEQRAKSDGVDKHIQFDLGDGEKLPYPDNSFAAATIQGVLHHLPDNGPLLREAFRVLRDEGELYISEPCKESTGISQFLNHFLPRLKSLFKLRSHHPDVSEHEAPISGPKLLSDLRAMGFAVEAEYLVNVGVVRFLPKPLRIWVTLALSLPTRHRNGDLIFVVAKKRSSTFSSLI